MFGYPTCDWLADVQSSTDDDGADDQNDDRDTMTESVSEIIILLSLTVLCYCLNYLVHGDVTEVSKDRPEMGK